MEHPHAMHTESSYPFNDEAPYPPPGENPFAVHDQTYSSSTPSVVGPQFCTPYPVDLAIVKKRLKDKNFSVTDVNGNSMFTVKGKSYRLHDKKFLFDSAANPVVTLTNKVRTMHSRWHVYRGESTEAKDLLFTAKRASVIQLKTRLKVFLANNTKEDVCDFQVKGSWSERSCIVYLADQTTIAAQLHKQPTGGQLGKESFMVTINPNIDHAFIIAVIIILNEINRGSGSTHDGSSSSSSSSDDDDDDEHKHKREKDEEEEEDDEDEDEEEEEEEEE